MFLRGLLPADRVRAAGELIAATLRAGGWTAAGSPRLSPAAGPREALADPAYRTAVLSLAFNELPYLAPLRGTVRRMLGPGAFSYPVKVLRAVPPESPVVPESPVAESPVQRARGRYVHCDYMGSGVQDMLTTWMPLAEVPSALGGLAVRPGGHRNRPRHPRLLSGSEPGWATTDYRPGGRGGLSLPDAARSSAQHRSPASAVRRLPLAGARLSRPGGDDSRARGASTRAIAPAAVPRSLVGTGPAGPDAPAARGTGCPAAAPVAVFRGQPAMAAVAFPARGSSLSCRY